MMFAGLLYTSAPGVVWVHHFWSTHIERLEGEGDTLLPAAVFDASYQAQKM